MSAIDSSAIRAVLVAMVQMALVGLAMIALLGTLAYGLPGVEIRNASFPWS